MDRGAATNKMQKALRSTEANNLFHAVCSVLDVPSGIYETRFPYSAGRLIAEAIARDITSGDTAGLRTLQKCVEAAHLLRQHATKARQIRDALIDQANNLQRIPTWQEVRDRCEGTGYPCLEDSNFRKDIKAAGLNWLIGKP
jgi:hypothetical protein